MKTLLTATAMVGLLMTGCNFTLPELPKINKYDQTTDIGELATKKPNQLTEKECEELLKMQKEAKEAKKIADEETRVKGSNRVKGSIFIDAANKASKLQKIYYLTEKLNYCESLNETKIDIDIEKIMEINR